MATNTNEISGSDISDLARQAADARGPVALLHVLESITPCKREAVLGQAVSLFNKENPDYEQYDLKITENGGAHTDVLERAQPSFLGLGPDTLVPVLTIEIPASCSENKIESK